MKDEVIGRVVSASGRTVWTLLGEDEWTVEVDGVRDADAELGVTEVYRRTYGGPADGYYGPQILQDLGERMGGLVELRSRPAAAHDMIF